MVSGYLQYSLRGPSWAAISMHLTGKRSTASSLVLERFYALSVCLVSRSVTRGAIGRPQATANDPCT